MSGSTYHGRIFPGEQDVYSIQGKNRQGIGNFPTGESRMDEVELYKVMRPLMLTFRLVGLLPFRTDNSGKAGVKIICPVTLYSILVQTGMTVAAGLVCKQRFYYIHHKEPSFSGLLVEMTFIGSLLPLLLSPLTQLPEAGKKAAFYNDWFKLQKSYLDMFGRPIHMKYTVCVKLLLAVTVALTALITASPFLTLEGIEWWYGIPFAYTIFISLLNSALWRVNGLALVHCAKILATDIEHLASNVSNIQSEKIADYRWFWLQLCKLTQAKGSSMGFTYGAQLIGYFFEQVLAVYGLMANYRNGFEINNLVCLGSVIIFSSLILLTCNTAQSATDEVGANVKEKLQNLFHQIPSQYTEARQETRLFIQTILENPPIVNLSGFVVVNRGLQSSLMSAMVTYLVVLIQFQMSTSPKNQNQTTLENALGINGRD